MRRRYARKPIMGGALEDIDIGHNADLYLVYRQSRVGQHAKLDIRCVCSALSFGDCTGEEFCSFVEAMLK